MRTEDWEEATGEKTSDDNATVWGMGWVIDEDKRKEVKEYLGEHRGDRAPGLSAELTSRPLRLQITAKRSALPRSTLFRGVLLKLSSCSGRIHRGDGLHIQHEGRQRGRRRRGGAPLHLSTHALHRLLICFLAPLRRRCTLGSPTTHRSVRASRFSMSKSAWSRSSLLPVSSSSRKRASEGARGENPVL